jgi:hypothetical protein
MSRKSNAGFPRWITAEGTIDLVELPIDGILKQAIDPEFERFHSACRLLGSMAGAGRVDAGVYLIGLLGCYASDLQRLEVIAGQLAHFPHESSANALLAEIRRVRSSNTTRRYLDRVLRSLAVLPLHLVKSGLEVLAEDTSFSPKMRAKFRNYCERISN